MSFATTRLRFACSEPLKYGANAAAQFDEPQWPRFVRITDITEDGRLREETFRSLPPEEAAPYILEDGDLLLARSGSIGRSFIYRPQWGEVCHAGYLIRARLDEQFDPKFVFWALNSKEYWAWIESIAIRSTIQNVSAEKYADFAVPNPPLETQRHIAAFLDEKTAQIDGLIAKKRELLERLAEKRQASITQAVTKGLNPEAPMKDSGIDWLGQIPAHWEALPLRRIAETVVTGRTPPAAAGDYFTDGVVPWFTPGDFRGLLLHDSEKALIDDAFAEGLVVRYPANSVLLVGIGATLGKVGLAPMSCSSNQQINAISVGPKHDPLFLSYFLHAFRAEVRMSASGNTLPILNQGKTKSIVVAIPPRNEQSEIGTFLKEWDAKIDRVEGEVRKSIEHLLEYRSALVTRAVTGKIEELQ